MSSAFAGTIRQQPGSILQQVVTPYTPSGVQEITTTNSDILGSSIAFTPRSSSSIIVYSYVFTFSGVDFPNRLNIKLLIDGTVEDESKTTYNSGDGTSLGGDLVNFSYPINSWGTTEKTLKLQARDYETTKESLLHITNRFDGTTSTQPREALLTITEYAANWTPPAVVEPSAGDILQSVVQEYDPSAAQSLTTTYADINGSDYSFTPVSASSEIVYEYNFQLACDTGTTSNIAHGKLLVDGVDETESKLTWRMGGNTNGAFPDGHIVYRKLIASWGTSAKTVKMQARESGSGDVFKVHETFYSDGAATSVLVRALLTITEYAT